MVEIPLTNVFPFYVQRTILEGAEFHLELSYNQREDRWYLHVQNANGEHILSGVKIVCDVPVFRKIGYKRPSIPPGELIFLDESTAEPPGFADLGQRVKLYYFTAEEIAA